MKMQPPKLISPNVVRDKTSLSEREQRRKVGFPTPVKLGYGPSGRIAYVEAEIDAWCAARVAERDGAGRIAPDAANDPAEPAPVSRPRGRRPGSAAPRDTAPAPAALAAAPPSGK
jgi:predicted DNA-binding transcriptional regulator AlpA